MRKILQLLKNAYIFFNSNSTILKEKEIEINIQLIHGFLILTCCSWIEDKKKLLIYQNPDEIWLYRHIALYCFLRYIAAV